MRRGLVGLVALCGALVALAVSVSPASAVMLRTNTANFGPDGTSATSFSGVLHRLDIDQDSGRLLMQIREPAIPEGIYGFDISTPGVTPPLGGAFPIPPAFAGAGAFADNGLAIDNSNQPTNGNIYLSSASIQLIYGYSPDGTPMGHPFPLNPAQPKGPAGLAVDSEGIITLANNSGEAKSNGRGVLRYKADGTELLPISTLLQVGNSVNVAYDGDDNLYVASLNGEVWKYTKSSDYTYGSVVTTTATNAIAVDRSTGHLFAAHNTAVSEFDSNGVFLRQFATGIAGAAFNGVAIDETTKTVYVSDNSSTVANKKIRVFELSTPTAIVPNAVTKDPISATRNSLTVAGRIDPDGGPNVTECVVQYATNAAFTAGLGTAPCSPAVSGGSPITVPTDVAATMSGLTMNTSYFYRFVATNVNGSNNGNALSAAPKPVFSTFTKPATNVTPTSATLNGSFDPDVTPTTYYFQYGTSTAYGSFAPVSPPGLPIPGVPGVVPVSANISNLQPGGTYNYRLVAINSFGTSNGPNMTFIASAVPSIENPGALRVNTDGAVLRADVNANGYPTVYRFEYGTEPCAISECTVARMGNLAGVTTSAVTTQLFDLLPGQTYYTRTSATNLRGKSTVIEQDFTTFLPEDGVDNCDNVLVRKQTGAGVAPKCRAYELVSAADSNGYDVESNLIPGLDPMPGYPRAEGKVLYTLRHGALSGVGNPTNRGGDPYVATRGEDGWSTEYVGLQADGPPSLLPFSSTLAGADDGLTAFAFAGPEVCNPCFDDGSQNIPLRLPDGSVIQGIAGSEDPGPADPAGKVAKRFSADGSHFVFGTTTKLEPAGNSGSLSIYDRNLDTNTTQVVSTLPDGSTMPGTGVEELDISSDGSRILIGRLVGTDTAGNPSYDLYMHVGTDPESVLIADTANGVRYAGMSSDGTKVFLTTADPLPGDADAGADLFRADVTPTAATLSRVSTGTEGTGDLNTCNPVANLDGNNWNAVGVASTDGCGVVAIAGGGGVSEGDGTAYFLSPEKLDGAANGTLNSPNLYVVEPGSVPKFVATLEPNNPLIRHAVSDAEKRDSADLQVTPDGDFSAFATDIPLTGAITAGYVEIYRYASGGGIACASCIPTNAVPFSDTTLTSGGLNLVDDGRVVFTSSEQLILRDTNQLKDVYEWDEGTIGLVSTGLDTNDSGLLTASADGVDIFFFTRQSLSPQDGNGGAMKIYDAREGGGLLFNPPPRPCAASDECHGAGTTAPPPAPIGTRRGTEEAEPPVAAVKRCRKGFVKKRKKCVKRVKRKNHRHSGHRNG